MMDALEADEVSGIFVERTSGYYYRTQDRNMSRSLVTSQHVPLTASLGLAITSDEAYINMTDCLSYMKNYIRQEILTLTSVYKVFWPTPRIYVFDVTSVGQRSPPWSRNPVKFEINSSSSASSVLLVHSLCSDKCIEITYQ